MTDDATLSDFVSADGEEAGEADDAEEPLESATTADSGFSTYAWGAYTCGRCEETTTRVWRDDGDLVCPNCKTW